MSDAEGAGASASGMLELALSFFAVSAWPVQQTGVPGLFWVSQEGQHGRWRLFVQAHPARPQLVFYSLFPRPCPRVRRTDCLELLARANDGLIVGNFEYHFDQDEVRFKTSADLTGVPHRLEVCNPLVYYNVSTMDRYYRAIEAVLTQGTHPLDALKFLA